MLQKMMLSIVLVMLTGCKSAPFHRTKPFEPLSGAELEQLVGTELASVQQSLENRGYSRIEFREVSGLKEDDFRIHGIAQVIVPKDASKITSVVKASQTEQSGLFVKFIYDTDIFFDEAGLAVGAIHRFAGYGP